MPNPVSTAPASIDVDTLFLLVVGAHPRAELHDRAAAYRLRDRIAQAIAERAAEDDADAIDLVPLVVTDVWYLNDQSLRACPTVSIGGPGVNALSAWLGDKLPSAFVVDDVLMVQLDAALGELVACCWGVDAEATTAAVDAFAERYLESFLNAAASRTAR